MKLLFIGGIGNISWYCTQKALERGHEVWHLNRQETVRTRRKVQPEVHLLKGDIRDVPGIQKLLEGCRFDAVCDFICYNAGHAEADLELFRGKAGRFVFISSDAVCKRSAGLDRTPFTEDSAVYDAETCDCDYIVGKLQAEQVFWEAYRREGFPVTIIRPSYTYDTIFPISIGHNCFTAEELILQGYPLLVAGDGENLWQFTHSSDFANALVGLLENPAAVGECFQISTEEQLTWNEQSEIVLKALHASSSGIFHVPYQDARKLHDIQPEEMMLQRMQHNIHGLDKLKSYVPDWRSRISFEEGIRETVDWLNESSFHKRSVARLREALLGVYRQYGIRPARTRER